MLQATELMAQMRQEIMDSLRADLRSEFQSRVDQLENQCELLQQANSDLKRECEMLKEKQLRDQAKILHKFVHQAKYLEVVRKYKNWEYPYDLADYVELLLTIGYDRDESTHILDVINRLKDYTIKMRRGEHSDVTLYRFSVYYEEMMPHFKEFADALSEYRHTVDYMEDEIFIFSLDCEGLPNLVLDLLQDALQRTHFDEMSFYCNVINEVSHIDFIANCITADIRLNRLTLDGITLENTRDINSLCAAVNNNHSLENLIMFNSCLVGIGDLREIFNKLKSPTLVSMELTRNNISNLLPGDISDLLSSNPSLRILDLRGNPFSGQDIVYIADALRNNTSLRNLRLGLSPNRVLPGNWPPLLPIVFDQTSLNSAYDSNHLCHLEILSPQFQTHPVSKFNKYEDPTLNRRKKIYHILSTRNRNRENAAYFEYDDIGIIHMPRILALLKPFSEHHLDDKEGKEDDEVEPLSIAYEITRDWKMPELYNYLDVVEED
eukprot:scaffold11362_cov37-Cyclotella_meneghiniana.AAC.2